MMEKGKKEEVDLRQRLALKPRKDLKPHIKSYEDSLSSNTQG
jgi:hypothetical protein